MELRKQIWNLSKWRFLQGEASLWVISNKALEYALLVGVLTWVYFEFFSHGIYKNINYIGVVIVIYSVSEIRSRIGLYKGYFAGYERGFEDASTRNCDYLGGTHNEISDNLAINAVLEEIKNNEGKISNENKETRANEVDKGLSQLAGYIFTWCKIN
jgi:hypothetical protein